MGYKNFRPTKLNPTNRLPEAIGQLEASPLSDYKIPNLFWPVIHLFSFIYQIIFQVTYSSLDEQLNVKFEVHEQSTYTKSFLPIAHVHGSLMFSIYRCIIAVKKL